MSMLSRRWLGSLVLCAACALPSRPLAAGDTQEPSDRDRAIAVALESANLRIRAKIEQSGILDRQGRHDEALEALRAVEGIEKEGVAFVERLTAAMAGDHSRSPAIVPERPRVTDAVDSLLHMQR